MKVLTKNTALFLILMILLFSCASVVPKTRMSEGEKLYRSKCTVCHNLVPPSKFSFEKWNEYIEKYGKELNQLEKEFIINYLKQNSKK
ncbi:MAG: hypothetical protein AB1410_05335 [Acidobacteriota bacterium]